MLENVSWYYSWNVFLKINITLSIKICHKLILNIVSFVIALFFIFLLKWFKEFCPKSDFIYNNNFLLYTSILYPIRAPII